MADSIAGARLHLFHGYGHGLSLIAPEQCVAEIKEFWKSAEENI
jgi:pimeloyl-ACP methyl ester carboxylesterase